MSETSGESLGRTDELGDGRGSLGQTHRHAAMKRPSGVVLFVSVMIIATACSGHSSPSMPANSPALVPSPPSPVSALPTPLGTGGHPVGAVSMATAWGDVRILTLPTVVGSESRVVFENAGTPDGQWLIVEEEPRTFPNSTGPCYAALYNVRTGAIVRMTQLPTSQTQILAASADDRWVVWSESADSPNFYAWRLVAYDRRTGLSRELARADTSNGSGVPGPYPWPSVSQGHVVWGQAVAPLLGANPDMSNAVVRMVDLATGLMTTLATSAGMPELSWPMVAWDVASGTSGYVLLTDVVAHKQTRLDVTPPTFALAGRSAAYNDPASTSVFLMDDVTSREASRLIAQGHDQADHLEWVTLNDRIVAWSQSTSTQVFDRREGRLVSLPVGQGRSAVYVCGPLVVWESLPPGESQYADAPVIQIIDSSTLPVGP